MNEIDILRDTLKKLHFEILLKVYSNIEDEMNIVNKNKTFKYGDISYAIDIKAEEIINNFFSNTEISGGCIIVAEGIGEKEFPSKNGTIKYKIIIDPIDGTREIMYDKRSAWILTGVALNKGPNTILEDIFLSIQTEIPIQKQKYFSFVFAEKNNGAYEEIYNINDFVLVNKRTKLFSSKTETLQHGYAVFVNFFPGMKKAISELEDFFFKEVLNNINKNDALIFSDQYLSTGGQIYLLASRRYRMVIDLRHLFDLFYKDRSIGLCCHPYDLCTFLIAVEAGCIIRNADSYKLESRLETNLDIDWIGFANKKLEKKYWRIISKLLTQMKRKINRNN